MLLKMASKSRAADDDPIIRFVMIIVWSFVISLSIMVIIFIYLDQPFLSKKTSFEVNDHPCPDICKITLVESIPENLTFTDDSPSFPSTFSAWETLLTDAKQSVDIAVFYWSLMNDDVTPVKMPSAWEGEEIFNHLMTLGKSRKLKMRIAQNAPNKRFPQNNSQELSSKGDVEVRSIDFDHLMGGGVLHTKMWIVDNKHFYLGSANMDWQSLTQVKEAGILVQNCSCLAEDMRKVFEVYWRLGGNASNIPSHWPNELETTYNVNSPMSVNLSSHMSKVFISSAPLPFNPNGRTNDIDAIVSVIQSAEKFVYIAVMDYFPLLLYGKNKRFWPVIDTELRRAAYDKKVKVRLLASHWNHTRPSMVRWMKSLQDISSPNDSPVSLETKLFVVPSYTKLQKLLPFARVNHNKYMVTDKTALVGTSNWSGDYFTKTAGVSVVISDEEGGKGPTLREQLESLFKRDWSSEYAKSIDDVLLD